MITRSQRWILLVIVFCSLKSISVSQQTDDERPARHRTLAELERDRPGYDRGLPVTNPNFRVNYRNHPYDKSRDRYLASAAAAAEIPPDRFLYKSIRIALYTLPLKEAATTTAGERSAVKWLVNTVLPAAVDYWSKALSVIPVQGNLVLDKSQLRQETFCGTTEAGPVPKEHVTKGVPDADLIIYVTATTRYCSETVLASAIYCNTDQYDRPIAGTVGICLSAIPYPHTKALTEEYTKVAIHEIAHVLGVSGNAFLYFWDPVTKEPRTPRPFVYQQVECANGSRILTFLPSTNTLHVNSEDHTAYVVTPRVATVVQNHFHCPTLIGAALEADPSNFCYGSSHWEERLFATELMSSVYIRRGSEGILSPLTLALLEDSGWYVADYTQSQISPWGHQAGCAFVQDPCLTTTTGKDRNSFSSTVLPHHSRGYFCTDDTQLGCSADLTHKRGCALFEYAWEDRPEPQFFADWRLGGPVSMDYCPVFTAHYVNDDGNEISLDCRGGEAPDYNPLHEVFGRDSRCILSDVRQAVCLRTECSVEEMAVNVYYNDDDRIVCRSDFETNLVLLGSAKIPVQLTCPRLAQACPDLFCPYNCAGRGICRTEDETMNRPAVCQCFDSRDNSPGCTTADVWAPSATPTSTPQPTSSLAPSVSPTISSEPTVSLTPSCPPSNSPSQQPSNRPSAEPSLTFMPSSSSTWNDFPRLFSAVLLIGNIWFLVK